MKKLTFEEVYKTFKDEGCVLLETEYINAHNKMKYRCSCGNESVIRFYSFKNGHKCAKCGGKEKHKFEDVYKYFEEKGCRLLETEYITNKTLMKYKCKCGNESSIRFNDFQRDHKCAKCSGTEKHKFEDVYKYFEEKGCELLESEYINSSTKMKYRCGCGTISSKEFSSFKSGKICKECGIKKRTGVNNPRYNTDRTRSRRSFYLLFDLNKLHVLSDDPNYINHIQSQKDAKASGNRWDRSDYTIDHIQPRIAFIDNNLDKKYDPVIIKEICNLRENLRIIPRTENGSKGGKYNQEEFMNWFNEKLTVYHTI